MIWWIAILPESNPMKTQLMVSYLELPWRLHAEQNALCGIFLHISPLLFFHPPLICSNFCLWSIQKARSLVHSKDSIAVNLIWCLLCKHPLLCWGTSTESIGEVWSTGSILRKHFLNYVWQAASVYEKPHRLPLAKTLPLLYFYTIAFCWAIAFFF